MDMVNERHMDINGVCQAHRENVLLKGVFVHDCDHRL